MDRTVYIPGQLTYSEKESIGYGKLYKSPWQKEWLRTSGLDDISLLTSHLHIYLVLFCFHYKSYHNSKLFYILMCLLTFHSYAYVMLFTRV